MSNRDENTPKSKNDFLHAAIHAGCATVSLNTSQRFFDYPAAGYILLGAGMLAFGACAVGASVFYFGHGIAQAIQNKPKTP